VGGAKIGQTNRLKQPTLDGKLPTSSKKSGRSTKNNESLGGKKVNIYNNINDMEYLGKVGRDEKSVKNWLSVPMESPGAARRWSARRPSLSDGWRALG
jgi:hypothetical protein